MTKYAAFEISSNNIFKELMKTPHNKINVGAQSNVWVVTFIKTIWDIDMFIVFLIDPRIRSIEIEKSNL